MAMLLNQFLSKLNHLRSFPQFFEEKNVLVLLNMFPVFDKDECGL